MFYGNASRDVFITGTSVPVFGPDVGTGEGGRNAFLSAGSAGINIANDTGNTIDATHGIWDCVSSAEVDGHIWDDDEDPSLGPVLFEPWWPYRVLEDDFETGDLSKWSRTVP